MQAREKSRVSGLHIALLMLLCVVTFLCFLGGIIIVDFYKAQQDFNTATEQVHQNFSQKILINESILDGFSAFLTETGLDHWAAARSYAYTMLSHYPHIHMLQVAQKISGTSIRDFTHLQRLRSNNNFELRYFDYNTNQLERAEESHRTYVPILFAESIVQDTSKMIGIDLFSFEFLKEVIIRVQHSERISISKPFKIHDGSEAFSFVSPILQHQDYFVLLIVKSDYLIHKDFLDEKNINLALSIDNNIIFNYVNEMDDFDIWPTFNKNKNIDFGDSLLNMEMIQYLNLSIFSVGFIGGALIFLLILIWSVWVLYRFHVKQQLQETHRNQRLYHLANYDELTGLANRAHFFDYTKHAFISAKRRNSKIGILYLDLNEFKSINDVYGHKMGDTVLMFLSGVLLESIRADDLAARLGGDEFVVMLDHIDEYADINKCVNRIYKTLQTKQELNDIPLMIKVSIGAAIFPDDGENLDQLLQKADSKMYEAKNRL